MLRPGVWLSVVALVDCLKKVVDSRCAADYIVHPFADKANNGVWRSLVARLLREQEAPGSNPGTPILNPRHTEAFFKLKKAFLFSTPDSGPIACLRLVLRGAACVFGQYLSVLG